MTFSPQPSRGTRFLFYTNECVGLGHLRRTLTLARAVCERDADASALVITGAPLAPGLTLPARVDTVKLPMLARDPVEGLEARNLAMDRGELLELRAALAAGAARSFEPDVAVIDKLPRGLGDELDPALEALRAIGSRVVLGLRDVEDDPAEVRRRWRLMGARAAIERYYDAVLVYGPPSGADDALGCVGWDRVPVPVHHVGYIGAPLPAEAPDDLPDEYLLATVGGGADGYDTLAATIDGVRLRPLPLPLVVVTGPLMAAADVDDLRRRADGLDVVIHQARADIDAVVAGARAVVAMAGYNTVAEIARAGHPALLVPRARPSREQLIRAQALADRGTFAMVHPDQLDAPRMAGELHALLRRPRPAHPMADHAGATRAAEVLVELAAAGPALPVATTA